MKMEDLIKDLDPITIIEFKNYLLENLTELMNHKNSNSKIIPNNQTGNRCCNECGCILYKNGKTKTDIQKYICSGCKRTTSETTGTITYHSKLSRVLTKVNTLFFLRKL